MNRLLVMATCWLGLSTALLQAQTSTQPDDTSETIRTSLRAYMEAFNRQDLPAVTAAWSEQATHVDRETGVRTEGREAIAADLAQGFEDRPDARLAGSVDVIRLIRPDVVHIEGETLLGLPGEEPVRSPFSGLLVMEGDRWTIASIEEHPAPTPESPYQALSQLEWLVGQWVDDADASRVDTTVRWSANQAFLIRSYVVRDEEGIVSEGTQVIGWDPRSHNIRSWSFASDGSFQDGVWSRVGEDWIIKASGCLPSGEAASGTYVLTPVDEDRLTIQLIGHEIDGDPQPTEPAVEMVRVWAEVEAVADADADAETEAEAATTQGQ